jgi:ParB-like chromosome segregation protein Spo0J
VGVLVPLIVYEDPDAKDSFVLMDGERRWVCSLDLGLSTVPANVIPPPSALDNLLKMFNIHSVRDEWPLISVALSLREVIAISGEDRESRLAEMTGLTRGTVRRAKRLLSIPDEELELIQQEAHLDRTQQIHREDLYLEIEAAESVIRNELPEVGEKFDRDTIIRQFARKREAKKLRAVTGFRDVGKLIKAAETDLVDRDVVVRAVVELIEQEELDPEDVYKRVAEFAFEQQALARKAVLFQRELESLRGAGTLSEDLRRALAEIRALLDDLLGDG